MKVKIILCLLFFHFTGNISFAQSDSLNQQFTTDSLPGSSLDKTNTEVDEEFNIFLLVFATVMISIMAGAAIAGTLVTILILLLLAGFTAVGILSVSVLAGLYKKSITSGFKTFLYILCPLIGIFAVIAGCWILINLSRISLSNQTGMIAGAIGGLLGGLLMAFAISKITIILINYFRKKFTQTNSGNP